MANYFVDSTTGDDGDDGTTMDLAWATLKYALENGSLGAGDTIWVRRVHSETLAAAISCIHDGNESQPLLISGWPRNSDSSITEADWTNGSTTVDNIVGLSMDREQHLGRYITGPDGFDYIIEKITDSDTIVIDREYAGSTVTSTDGACTIKADEGYSDAQAIDDSGWTIQKSDWNADADDLAQIDFDDDDFYIYIYGDSHYHFRHLDFVDSAYSQGMVYCRAGNNYGTIFEGCLFRVSTSANGGDVCASFYDAAYIKRCIFDGQDVGRALYTGYFPIYIEDSCAYTSGNYGIQAGYPCVLYLENVNVGIISEPSYGILMLSTGIIYGSNVNVSGSVVDVFFSNATASKINKASIENFGKVLGAHKVLTPQGTIIKTDVVAGSGDPYKRSGGAGSVLEVQFDKTGNDALTSPVAYFTQPIFTHEFEATTDKRNYRYYVQAEGAVTASQLWIEVEYVASYDDTSEYVITKVTSDEAITARADASDWSQYIEVEDIEPAVASTVRIKCYCSYYHATNKIYIDPLPEVTT